MFRIGDRVSIKPYYAGSIEEFFGLKRTVILTVGSIDIIDGEAYLTFNHYGQVIELLADFFDHEMTPGFVLDEVE